MIHRKLFSKTIKCTGNITIRHYRDETYEVRERVGPDEILSKVFQNKKIASNEDWRKVRSELLDYDQRRTFTPINIDSSIIGFCTKADKHHLATSYYQFLNDEKIKPNLATVGKYLKFLYEKNSIESSTSDQTEILSIYKELRKKYPVLDSITLENVIMALSITNEWKSCEDLLKEIQVTTVGNNAAYSAFISAAFLNGETELAWKYLNEMLEKNRYPKSIIYISYLKSLQKLRAKASIHGKLEELFTFLKDHDIRIENDVVKTLEGMSETLKISIKLTNVNTKGACRSCLQQLKKFELTNEEFEELKDKILNNIILGKDIFVKTNPQELSRFENFIARKQKFDVVLDGLNIAYSVGTRQSPHVFSTLLANVVKYFVSQNKEVLVLGRVHMNRWPVQTWNYIKNSATVFLTQNISEDDPYLLYCGLNSGKNTIIVTRDLMRSHRFLLKSVKHKILFNRWLSQRQHQFLRTDARGQPVFKYPLPFTPSAQKIENYWHLPFDEVENQKQEYINSWCCVKLE